MLLVCMHRVACLFQSTAVSTDSRPAGLARSTPAMAARASCKISGAHPPGSWSALTALFICKSSRVLWSPDCMLSVGNTGCF